MNWVVSNLSIYIYDDREKYLALFPINNITRPGLACNFYFLLIIYNIIGFCSRSILSCYCVCMDFFRFRFRVTKFVRNSDLKGQMEILQNIKIIVQ